jgi:hypothetical protein
MQELLKDPVKNLRRVPLDRIGYVYHTLQITISLLP